MEEITREEFYDLDASHMAEVTADEREFYRIGEERVGVLGVNRNDSEIRVRGIELHSSPPDGRYRVNGSKSESARNEDGLERAREKVEEWLSNR